VTHEAGYDGDPVAQQVNWGTGAPGLSDLRLDARGRRQMGQVVVGGELVASLSLTFHLVSLWEPRFVLYQTR